MTKLPRFYLILCERFSLDRPNKMIELSRARELMSSARIKRSDANIIIGEMVTLGLLKRRDKGGRLLEIILPAQKKSNNNWFSA